MTLCCFSNFGAPLVVVELRDKDFAAGLTFVAISRVKTLKGLAFRTHFDHARLIMKPKETDDSMLILRRDTEHHSQLGFQLNRVWICCGLKYFILLLKL